MYGFTVKSKKFKLQQKSKTVYSVLLCLYEKNGKRVFREHIWNKLQKHQVVYYNELVHVLFLKTS